MIEKYAGAEFDVKTNPALYYQIIDLMKSVDEAQLKKLEKFQERLEKEIKTLVQKERMLSAASDNFMKEAVMRVKTKTELTLDNDDEDVRSYNDQRTNFITMLSNIVSSINVLYRGLYETSQQLRPASILDNGDRLDKTMGDTNAFQLMMMQMGVNSGNVTAYAQALAKSRVNKFGIVKFAEEIHTQVECYYKMLLNRHTKQGVKIYKHPILTDLAYKIYKNVDANGEIESRQSDKVSAYTMRKAQIIAKAVKDPLVHGFIKEPDSFIGFITDALQSAENMTKELENLFDKQSKQLTINHNFYSLDDSVSDVLKQIESVNPSDISFVPTNVIHNESEKLVDEMEEKTITQVVDMMLDGKSDFNNLVHTILLRKSELVKFWQDENSFYVCQIGSGNAFSGKSVGALEVIPAQKPRASLDNIRGSGFDEIKEFLTNMKTGHKWHELYVATSPSKSVDKNNVLLIGAMGCGKTEIFRAVGADNTSISISAQGSDFFTAWAGEAQKNPKRLFQAALKLSNESGKMTNILIDEIDDLLNNDKDGRKHFDLTKEFQILMDGVVSYPNLAIWGATNSPERIPMPMIRRFNKVVIVGELSDADIQYLLKYYVGHMPLEEFGDEVWADAAKLLVGATGDVVRKVADELWRTKMNKFIQVNPELAAKISLSLKHPVTGELHKKIEEIKDEKNKMVKAQQYEESARLRDEERRLLAEYEKIQSQEIPFHVDTFDREAFKKKLKGHVSVSAGEIINAVESCLRNVGIKSEIDTAIKVYADAKKIVSIAHHTMMVN